MSIFTCPICSKPISKIKRTYSCQNNHCFDISKEGYINLLPANAKKSKNPGDNDKMIIARRNFLETDLYKPLAKEITKIIKELTNTNQISEIFDLGCGEGYYSGIISKELTDNVNFSALDISKVAIKYGSKRHKNVSFVVASAYSMPVSDNSIDLLYRIFAPSDINELERTIKNNGFLVTVTPSENHLIELRKLIYDNVKNLSTKSDSTKSFKEISHKRLSYSININDKKTIINLLEMTPFGWKIQNESYETLLNKDLWEITCDFNIDVYKKVI